MKLFLAFSIFLLDLIACVKCMKTLEFGAQGQTWESHGHLTDFDVEEGVDEFTMCYRMKIFRFIPTAYWLNIFEYASPSKDKCCELRSLWMATGPIAVIRNKFVALSNVEVKLMKWYHYCFSFDYKSGKYVMVLDGQVVSQGTTEENFNKLLRGGSKVTLGIGSRSTCVASIEGATCASYFSGQMADLNIWNKSFSMEDMMDFTLCRKFTPDFSLPSIISWEDTVWQLHEVIELEFEMNDICKEREDSYFIFPELRSVDDSLQLCRTFGAELAAPDTPDNQNKLAEEAKNFFLNLGCPRIWLGWTDEYTEGTFININKYKTKEKVIQALPKNMEAFWIEGEPNGGRLESCAEFRYGNRWNDMPCAGTTKGCSACYFHKVPLMTLRGLCSTSSFDKKYILTKDFYNNKPSFKGYFRTAIRWESNEQGNLDPSIPQNSMSWQIRSMTMNSTYGKLMSKWDIRYPIGTQEWTIFGDTCHFGENRLTNLTLTVCQDGEFTCDNGECIKIHKRCNNAKDCEDSSDEVSCHNVGFPHGYRKAAPPPPQEEGKPLIIDVDVFVNSFAEINVNKMVIKIDFVLTLTWFDSRLSYFHLNESYALNALSQEEVQSIWFPELIFVNTAGNKISLRDDNTETYILKKGTYEYANLQELKETRIYKGSENPLMSFRKYALELICNFELKEYPFDIQNCGIELRLKRPTRREAVLDASKFHYAGGEDLLEYRVLTNLSTENEFVCGQQNLSSCAKVWVTLKRRVGNQLLNTYLPTTCLLLTIYLTHYFKLDHYDTRIMVGLTGMLVIASLFVSTSSSLPKTSYMKMIDVWMIFCFLLPFAEVILHTMVEFFAINTFDKHSSIQESMPSKPYPWKQRAPKIAFEKDDGFHLKKAKGHLCRGEKIRRGIDYFARIAVPIVIVGFNANYWETAFRNGGIEL